MVGRAGEPIRPAATSLRCTAAEQVIPRALYCLRSAGVTRPCFTSWQHRSRSPAGNEAVLYHGQDDLWAAPHSAHSHLAREENDLTLKKFGSQRRACVCACVCAVCVCAVCVCMVCAWCVCAWCVRGVHTHKHRYVCFRSALSA